MKSYAKAGYFTGWKCDVVVGNAMNADRHMQRVDKANNYMW